MPNNNKEIPLIISALALVFCADPILISIVPKLLPKVFIAELKAFNGDVTVPATSPNLLNIFIKLLNNTKDPIPKPIPIILFKFKFLKKSIILFPIPFNVSGILSAPSFNPINNPDIINPPIAINTFDGDFILNISLNVFIILLAILFIKSSNLIKLSPLKPSFKPFIDSIPQALNNNKNCLAKFKAFNCGNKVVIGNRKSVILSKFNSLILSYIFSNIFNKLGKTFFIPFINPSIIFFPYSKKTTDGEFIPNNLQNVSFILFAKVIIIFITFENP